MVPRETRKAMMSHQEHRGDKTRLFQPVRSLRSRLEAMQGLRGGFSVYAPRDCVLPLGPSTPILNGANSNCLPTCLPGQVEEVMTLAWLGMFCGPTVGTGTPRAACWGGAAASHVTWDIIGSQSGSRSQPACSASPTSSVCSHV